MARLYRSTRRSPQPGDDVESPTDDDVKSPTDDDVESPTDDDVESPTDDDVESPTDDDVESPTDDDVESPTDKVKDYLGKVVEHIPSEVVSIFLLGKAMFPGDAGKATLGIWAVVCWVLALIMRWFGTQGEGKTQNVVLTTLAFPIWVMAIGGTILGFTFGEQISALIVLAFSVLAGVLYNNK